mgnify:CR=1 FL=1|tara:strand:- start:218 stop:925 length:708 start_codon:yes stop_codon:yes gene_type:complete
MDTCDIMKAIPTTYNGIDFRSKLECRHYIFMKKIGWNVEYEPEVEDVYGYQPDFELFSEIEESRYSGKNRYFIEVKPIKNQAEFYGDKYKTFREKIYTSGILKKGILFIVGNNLKLKNDAEGSLGEKIFVYTFNMIEDENKINDKKERNNSLCSFSGCPEDNFEGIGLKLSWNDCRNDWIKPRTDSKCYYDVLDYNLLNVYSEEDDEVKTSKFIEKSWNEAWSKLQWKRHEEVDF